MSDGDVLALGTWHYDGHVPTAVKIVRQPYRRGSGDHEDPPAIRDGSETPCFVAWWGSPGDPCGFRSASGQHETLAEAMSAAEALVPSISWQLLPAL
ncbi:hypothetical protein SLT36_06970 [Aminobacter sp. BA135]|uniref:hypothetical protein n=1 Tax=Aminobacter sp. BA135 TaxID=537596 RepID=UPI003D791076